MRITTFRDADALGRAVAGEIADGIASAAAAGRRYLLGCPGGRSARTTYRALAVEVARRSLTLDHLVIAMMDEYVLPAEDGFRAVPEDVHFSCRGFARREISGPLAVAAGQDTVEVWLPDPAAAGAYDDRLAAAGGIDFFLLASGASDGHVAFNPPGTPADSGSRVVELADTTRTDNLATFPEFRGLHEVPSHGVTVGPATIVAQTRRAVLLLVGAGKRRAYRRVSAATGYDAAWPSTVIAACTDGRIFADEAAAG